MRALDLAVLQDGDGGGSPSFTDLVGSLMGIPCAWGTQSEANEVHSETTIATANLIGSLNVGDEIVRERVDVSADLPAGGARDVAYGMRERTIQITASSMSQRLDESARAYLEKLEDKIALPEVIDQFADLGLAILNTEGIQVLDPKAFGRVSSVASMDLKFRFGKRTAGADQPRIATTRVTGTVDGRAGALDVIEVEAP